MTKAKIPEPKIVTEVLVIKEPSLTISVLEDFITFTGSILAMWFNHAKLGGNGWVDFVFIVIVLLAVARLQSKRQHRFETKADAVKYLNNHDF